MLTLAPLDAARQSWWCLTTFGNKTRPNPPTLTESAGLTLSHEWAELLSRQPFASKPLIRWNAHQCKQRTRHQQCSSIVSTATLSASVCYIAADSHVAMTTIYAPLRGSLCSVKAGYKEQSCSQEGGDQAEEDHRRGGGGGGGGFWHEVAMSEKTLSEIDLTTSGDLWTLNFSQK